MSETKEQSLNPEREQVLTELFREHMHLVFGVCMKYLGEREKAKDAVMQVIEKLLTGYREEEIVNIRTWLFVITKNHCLMQIRSDKASEARERKWGKAQVEFMENDNGLHPLDEEDPIPEDSLKECMEKLKDEQKLCIQMFYYEDKCYREIAGATGMNEKNVKSHLQNGKRNLKLCLESKNVGKKETY